MKNCYKVGQERSSGNIQLILKGTGRVNSEKGYQECVLRKAIHSERILEHKGRVRMYTPTPNKRFFRELNIFKMGQEKNM